LLERLGRAGAVEQLRAARDAGNCDPPVDDRLAVAAGPSPVDGPTAVRPSPAPVDDQVAITGGEHLDRMPGRQ
jgi:hypothetical protein